MSVLKMVTLAGKTFLFFGREQICKISYRAFMLNVTCNIVYRDANDNINIHFFTQVNGL